MNQHIFVTQKPPSPQQGNAGNLRGAPHTRHGPARAQLSSPDRCRLSGLTGARGRASGARSEPNASAQRRARARHDAGRPGRPSGRQPSDQPARLRQLAQVLRQGPGRDVRRPVPRRGRSDTRQRDHW